MKRSDTGDFCVLYVEPEDDKAGLFQTIVGQEKPVVIMLAERTQLFQRPDDFIELKHVKRQLGKPVLFVLTASERLAQLAQRNGFPVYPSMDALSEALATGQMTRSRVQSRPPLPSNPGGATVAQRTTIPLPLREEAPPRRRTEPLSPPVTPLPPTRSLVRRSRLPAILLFLVAFALVSAALGSYLIFSHNNPISALTAPTAVGRVAFLSSNQVSESSNQGISDKVLVDLQNLTAPASGKKYYAWLIGDKQQSDLKTIALGALNMRDGHAQLLYPGDSKHTNLLSITSRFLITEEDALMAPVSPSLQLATWRYYGEFSQTPITVPNSSKRSSYLDHLRHLLASDPTLDSMELPGGLNTWFYRNTSKLLEWTTSMRDQWQEHKNTAYVKRQTVRVLSYLDGISFVQRDLPPNTPQLVNTRLARLGLLDMDGANQDPPCYLAHISHHLYGLLQVGNEAPASLRDDASKIVKALNNVKYWLEQVRHDARIVIKMSDEQLAQPAGLTYINNMIDNATRAFVGDEDPTTGEVRNGVNWIHNQMQSLATIKVQPFTGSNSSIQTVPGGKQQKAAVKEEPYA